MNSKIKNRRVNLEIPIVVTIAILMVILIKFSDDKLNELIVSDAEALFMSVDHNPNDTMHTELAEKISEFRPDTYKMIEVFDSNLDLIIRVQFDENDQYEDIVNYPELRELLLNNEDGHTSIEVNDEWNEYVYFKWSASEEGEMYLFIIYTYKPIVRNFWVFHAICYAILMMICGLLIRLSMRSYSDKLKYYKEISAR